MQCKRRNKWREEKRADSELTTLVTTLYMGLQAELCSASCLASNYVEISKFYLRLSNVSVMLFKIKPQNLDITTVLALMNVDEPEETPLYMAEVTQILRKMTRQEDRSTTRRSSCI